MTREEAINQLKDFIILHRGEHGWDVSTLNALDMAIKALEDKDVLDKIREEIEQLRLHKAEFLTSDNKVCIDSQEVLDVIDKYKVESEDKNEL